MQKSANRCINSPVGVLLFTIHRPSAIIKQQLYAPVAQLDRVSDSDSEGRWFESSRAYQKTHPNGVRLLVRPTGFEPATFRVGV